MELTRHRCLSSKQTNKNNASNSGLWQSIVIHALVLIVLLQTSMSNNHLTNNTQIVNSVTYQPLTQPIRASLVYAKQLVQLDNPSEEKTIANTKSTLSSTAPDKKQENIQTKKSIIAKDKLAKKQAYNSTTTLKNKSPENTKQRFDAFSSLENLSKMQNSYAMNTSMNDHNQQREKDKNTIKKSINVYGQIPEAKAKKLEVNCHNAVLKGLSIPGGLMGGSIKCNSYNGADKYINERLKRMSVDKEKAKKG